MASNEYMREYRKKNSEKFKQLDKKRYSKRRDKLLLSAKERYQKYKDYYKKQREDKKEERKAISRAWYKKNRERVLAYNKEYNKLNKEKVARSSKNARLKREYNITLMQYENMFSKQNGKCSICNNSFSILNIDHCHSTGKVRDLLCDSCNFGIGQFKDNIELLNLAINYLVKHGK